MTSLRIDDITSVDATISKYKRFINDKILNYLNDILSDFVSPYRSKYSSNHVILRLTEEWEEKLDKGFLCWGSSHGLI